MGIDITRVHVIIFSLPLDLIDTYARVLLNPCKKNEMGTFIILLKKRTRFLVVKIIYKATNIVFHASRNMEYKQLKVVLSAFLLGMVIYLVCNS